MSGNSEDIKNGIKSMHVRMCEAIQVSTEVDICNKLHFSFLFFSSFVNKIQLKTEVKVIINGKQKKKFYA